MAEGQPKPRKIRTYESEEISVTWDQVRCIHAKECIRGLSEVFDVDKRPWIQPGEASADAVAETVLRCPTGALQFTRKDGGPAETPLEGPALIVMEQDGPLYLRGEITLLNAAGEVIHEDTRVALCRCGASEHKPFCDGSHSEAEFTAPGTATPTAKAEVIDGGPAVSVKATTDGPLGVEGAFIVRSQYGQVLHAGEKTWLCRCGASANKPFCDGTHNEMGFKAQ